jgi:hypothetical protein
LYPRDVPKYSIIKIREYIHSETFSRMFLCQLSVNGLPCPPFHSSAAERARLGEDGWMKSLQENAEFMLAEHGPQPALL